MPGYEPPVFDLGNPTWIQAVSGPETPADLMAYAGRYLAVRDSGDLPPVGTRGIVRVNGINVPGYLRSTNGNWEWVIMPAQDPMEIFIGGMIGAQGWADQNAGLTWYNIGLNLRGAGISSQDIAWGFQQLFAAARAEIEAERIRDNPQASSAKATKP